MRCRGVGCGGNELQGWQSTADVSVAHQIVPAPDFLHGRRIPWGEVPGNTHQPWMSPVDHAGGLVHRPVLHQALELVSMVLRHDRACVITALPVDLLYQDHRVAVLAQPE